VPRVDMASGQDPVPVHTEMLKLRPARSVASFTMGHLLMGSPRTPMTLTA